MAAVLDQGPVGTGGTHVPVRRYAQTRSESFSFKLNLLSRNTGRTCQYKVKAAAMSRNWTDN